MSIVFYFIEVSFILSLNFYQHQKTMSDIMQFIDRLLKACVCVNKFMILNQ